MAQADDAKRRGQMRRWQSAQLESVARQVREANGGALWLGGYGSLPLRPEPGMGRFEPALFPDHEKSLCVRVTSCRGRPGAPGFVAGILPSPGDAVLAMVCRLDPRALSRLERRELDGRAYDPRAVRAVLRSGERRTVLAFTAAISHPDCMRLDTETLAEIVALARGCRGTNRRYLADTIAFERGAFGRATPSLLALEAAVARRVVG